MPGTGTTKDENVETDEWIWVFSYKKFRDIFERSHDSKDFIMKFHNFIA